MPISRRFEHKIEVFVLFWASKPSFSGVSSTKSGFLCAFGQYFLGFSPRRAQNRGFCALFSETVGFAGRGNLIADPAGMATWLLLLPGMAICFQLLLGVAI